MSLPEPPTRPPPPLPPDLQSQLEALLHEVWTEEVRWRLDDVIDLANRVGPKPRPGSSAQGRG